MMKKLTAVAVAVSLAVIPALSSAGAKKAPNVRPDARGLGLSVARMALNPQKFKPSGPIEGVFTFDPSKSVSRQLHRVNSPSAREAALCLKTGVEVTAGNPFEMRTKRADGSMRVINCGKKQLILATVHLKKLERLVRDDLRVYRPVVTRMASAAACGVRNPDACLSPDTGPGAGETIGSAIGATAGGYVGLALLMGIGYGIYYLVTGGSFWEGFADGIMEGITLGEWNSAVDDEGGDHWGEGTVGETATGGTTAEEYNPSTDGTYSGCEGSECGGTPPDYIDGLRDDDAYLHDDFCSAEESSSDPDCSDDPPAMQMGQM